MRVLCRPNQTQCFRTYDVQFPQIFCQKELALRILLQFVNSKSIPHNLRIRPLLSLSTGHFVRLFIEVIKSPQKSLENLKYSSYGSFCDNCKSVKLIGNQMHNSQFKSKVRLDDLNCKICSKPQVQLGGRLWSGPLHCPDFLQQMLDSSKYVQLDNLKRCEAMLQVLKSELSIPFAFNTVEIARILKFGQPRLSSLLNNLTSNSFKWSFTLSDPECIKTTAPYNSFI
ncbi:MAG: RNA methyltransferase tRNA(m5U54)methyltransferase, partial [Marteilia pararefringens]